MSRRRRRDGDEGEEALSENEEATEHRSLSVASQSDIEDELDVSDYESVEEEERNSSDDEVVEEPPAKENKEPEKKDPKTKIILERKSETTVVEKQDSEVDTGQDNADIDPDNPERESGDGKEESDSEYNKNETERTVNPKEEKDEKEDDPAFTPTKGAFFQHDVRSDSQSHGRHKDKKLWDKGPAKWKHDMFIIEEQMPKSRDILISNYGYDIRGRPVDAPPPDRRSRGRGRGRGGGGRGWNSRGRGRYFSHEQKQSNGDEAPEYDDDYPLLGKDEKNSQKHRTKSYYNTQRYNNSRTKENEARDTNHVSRSTDNSKRSVSESENHSSSVSHRPENKSDEKFSDLLQVIQNRENAPPNEDTVSSLPTPSRNVDQANKRHQNGTFSKPHEAPKPRRYSSLRQKQSDFVSDGRNSSIPPRPREQKYANFPKPMQPSSSITSNFSTQSTASGNRLGPNNMGKVSQSPGVQSSVPQPKSYSQSRMTMPPMQQSAPGGVPPSSVNVPSLPFTDMNPALMNAQMDPSLMQMPQMLPLYNPMMNSSYLDAASNYQRMLRMMSQLNTSMDQMQQIPSPMTNPMDASVAGISPDPQTLPHPADMQMNPLVPPVSQTLSPGSLGSVMRPPHPINPPTYFTGPMNYNVTQQQHQQPQAPVGFHPSMLTQQVGGVTYFNTATQSPPIQPVSNQASPRRNAAIPIMAPTGFGGPAGLE